MISVIIPAYNAEKTIEQAVGSAVREIPEGEILVVENGSSDETTKTAETLAKQYPQLRVLHSRKGVSAARNLGLSEAKGDWILFLDADDLFAEGIGALLTACTENEPADLWLFGHFSGGQKRSVTDGAEAVHFSGNAVTGARVRMLENPTRYMQVWAKLFRASTIRQNNLTFNEKLSLSEDSDFTLRYSAFCERISFSPEILYRYSLDSASTMRTADGTKVRKYELAMEETAKAVEHEPEEIQRAFRKYVLMHLNIAMVRDVYVAGSKASGKEKRVQLRNTANAPVFSHAISRTRIGECFSLRMLPVLFLKLRCFRLAGLLFSVRAKQNAKREGNS